MTATADAPPSENLAVHLRARVTPSLTRTELYAAQLRSVGLNTPEIAHALGWTVAEAQVHLGKCRALHKRWPA